MTKENKIALIVDRIQLLRSRGKNNEKIIAKLKRKVRAFS